MKFCDWRGILGFVLAVGLASTAAAQETGAQSVDAAWMKAMKAGDVDGVVACYASDAVLWLPGAPEARGSKAIHDAYAGMLSANTVTDVSITDTHYESWQNLSLGWGHFMMTLKPKAGGAPTIMGGRFIDVAKKIDGKWRYVADHASVEPPPAAAAAPKP
jgi:uncharacterized protein (TIGR02246 family)